MIRIIYLLPIFIVLLTTSCNSKLKSPEKKRYVPRNRKMQVHHYKDPYIQTALSDCIEVGKDKYTEENTQYFDLNPEVAMDCFVFISELQCGGMSGSCGNSITVFKKFGTGYKVIYRACASLFKMSVEVNFGLKSFEFTIKDGIRFRVSFNGKEFKETPVSYNGYDYKKLKIIEENSRNFQMGTFTLDEYAFYQKQAGAAKVEKLKIGPNERAELFTLIGSQETYLLIQHNRLLFKNIDLSSVEFIKNDKKKYYDLKTFCSSEYKIARDTSYYIPSYYSYSEKRKKYVKLKTR